MGYTGRYIQPHRTFVEPRSTPAKLLQGRVKQIAVLDKIDDIMLGIDATSAMFVCNSSNHQWWPYDVRNRHPYESPAILPAQGFKDLPHRY